MEKHLMNLCNLVGRYIKIGFTQKMNLVLIEFVIFNLLVSICACLKCSVGSGNSNTIISDQGTFTGYSGVYTYGVISGPTSNSLYYMHYIEIPSDYIFIRKIYSNDTVAWMSGILLWPFMKSLAVDKNENHVYVASNDNPINVCRLLGSNGAISDAQTFSILDGSSSDIKIHVISDDSGYFVIGGDSSLIPNICKYLFSTPSISQCQQLPNLYKFAYGQLKLTESSYFFLSVSPLSPYPLRFYRVTFASLSPDWSAKLPCSSGTCTAADSCSVLSGNSIYSIFVYGITKYVYLVRFAADKGIVMASRYKSSISCNFIFGSETNGDFIATSAFCSSKYLIIFNIATSNFDIRVFNGFLYGIAFEPTTGRYVIGGNLSPNGYITKFMPQSIAAHTDFQVIATWTMNALAVGIEEIVGESGQIIGTVSIQSVFSQSYTIQPITFVLVTSYTSDVNYLTKDQSFTVLGGTTSKLNPDLPCSLSGSTSISYSLTNYLGVTVPTWITVNSSSGELTVVALQTSTNKEYYFYLSSLVSGISQPIQKLIKITVTSSLTNSSTKSASDFSNALSITSTSLTAAIVGVTVLTSLMNTNSIASLWMSINQLQLFYLLLLTRAFIPEDIQTIIKGSGFALNIYDYIPLKTMKIYPSFLYSFEFGLSNPSLDSFEIKDDSSIVNLYTIIFSFIIMIFLYLCILLIRCLIAKCSNNENRSCCTKVINWVVDRIFKLMTLGYFIRNILEMSQFIFISSLNEIYQHKTSNYLKCISFIFSILMIVLYIAFSILINYLALSSYRLNENAHNILGEFFRGNKYNKNSRFFVFIQLLRRFIFVFMLINLESVYSKLLIGILVFIQIVYIGYLIFTRPYELAKCNIIEILNEVYFCILLLILIFLNTESNWNSTKTSMYMWMLISNTLVIFIIIFVYALRDAIKQIKDKCQRSSDSNNDGRITPKSFVHNDPTNHFNQEFCFKGGLKTPSISNSNNLYEESKSNLEINHRKADSRKLKNWN